MLEQLLSKSDFLKEFHPVAREINSLTDGGFKSKAEDYLLIRENEDDRITKKRIAKFAPRNALGAALKYLRICQESGDVNIDNETLPGDGDLWEKFISSCDGSGKSLKEFAIDCFEQATKTKYSIVKIDLPYLDIPKGLNQASADKLLEKNPRIPYLTQIPIEDVLNYSEDKDGISWIKYKWLEAVENPLLGTSYNLNFIYIDGKEIITYTYLRVIYDDDFRLMKIWEDSLNGGGFRNCKPDEKPTTETTVLHQRGKCPIVKFELPDSLWQSNQVYRSQAVVYGLHMNFLHTVSESGMIQKWGKPYIIGGGAIANAPVPSGVMKEIVEKYAKYLGDDSIMMMEAFHFEEITGTSILGQSNVIDKICEFIFNSIIYKQNVLTYKPSVESGLSKEYDRESQMLALKANGSKICQLTKNILKQVARCFPSFEEMDSEEISVTGMDKFYLEPVGTALDTVERILSLPQERIPMGLVRESLVQLISALLENASQAEKQEVIKELDAIPPIAPIPQTPPLGFLSDPVPPTEQQLAHFRMPFTDIP